MAQVTRWQTWSTRRSAQSASAEMAPRAPSLQRRSAASRRRDWKSLASAVPNISPPKADDSDRPWCKFHQRPASWAVQVLHTSADRRLVQRFCGAHASLLEANLSTLRECEFVAVENCGVSSAPAGRPVKSAWWKPDEQNKVPCMRTWSAKFALTSLTTCKGPGGFRAPNLLVHDRQLWLAGNGRTRIPRLRSFITSRRIPSAVIRPGVAETYSSDKVPVASADTPVRRRSERSSSAAHRPRIQAK